MRYHARNLMLAAVVALGAMAGCGTMLSTIRLDYQVRQAIVAGDWGSAADLAKAWHQRAPEDEVPLRVMWAAYYRLADVSGLIETWKEIDRRDGVRRWDGRRVVRWGGFLASEHPDSANVWQVASYCAADRQDGVVDAEKAARLAPKDWRSWATDSLARREAHDYDGAIQDADHAISLRPNDPELFLARGLAYEDKHKYDKALADFGKAIGMAPKAFWYYKDRAHIYRKKKDYAHALADLNHALKLDPGYISGYRERAWVYHYQHDERHELANWNMVVELDPLDANARIGRMEARGRLDLPMHAASDGRAVLRLLRHATSAYDLTNRGDAYRYLGEQHAAIRDYDGATTLDPGDAWAWGGRGISCMILGRYDEAVADFTGAIGTGRALPLGYMLRGEAFAHTGEWSRALDDLGHAIALDPRLAQAYCDRSVVYEKMGRSAEAKEDAATGLRLWGALGRAFMDKERKSIDYATARRRAAQKGKGGS